VIDLMQEVDKPSSFGMWRARVQRKMKKNNTATLQENMGRF
jgi:hypothetical protein